MTRSETAVLSSQRLERFAQSQMTITQFCKSEGVSSAPFYHWQKMQASSAIRHQSAMPTKFVPVALTAAPAESPRGAEVGIELPGDMRVRINVPAAHSNAVGARQ